MKTRATLRKVRNVFGVLKCLFQKEKKPNPPSQHSGWAESQVNLQHLAQPATGFNDSKGFSIVMCSRLGVARLLRKVAKTPYVSHLWANHCSSIRHNCRPSFQEQDSSDMQNQNLLKLKTEMKTCNIKPCCRTTQWLKNNLGAAMEHYIANPAVYWQLLQKIFSSHLHLPLPLNFFFFLI